MDDDREVRELALQSWLSEHTPDIRRDRAALYAKTFYDNNASTIVRVGKMVTRDAKWLIQLQVDEDDADDIVAALRSSALVPPSNQLQKTQNSLNGDQGAGSARETMHRSDASSPMAIAELSPLPVTR